MHTAHAYTCTPVRTPMRTAMHALRQELCGPFGELQHVQLPLDEAGKKRGFGVVEFASADSCQAPHP